VTGIGCCNCRKLGEGGAGTSCRNAFRRLPQQQPGRIGPGSAVRQVRELDGHGGPFQLPFGFRCLVIEMTSVWFCVPSCLGVS